VSALVLLPSVTNPLHRRLILLLATVLLANPAILFLLTHSVWISIGAPLGCVFLLQWLATKSTRTLLTAYVFNFIAVISVFVHAEVLFVYGFPDYVIENLYTIEDGYYFNKPLLNQTFSTKEYVVHYRTNAQGFRIGQGQDAAQAYTNADWLVIGDSFTQGAQVDYSELYTSLLSLQFPDKIVVNAGISGLGIGHEFNYYTKAGHRLRPDIVILQLCSFNDFMNVEPSLVGFTDRLMTYSTFLRYLLADFKFTNPAELPLGRWTEPFHPDVRGNADFNIFYNESSPAKARDLAAFRRYLTLLRDAVRRNGSHLLVVLIPTKEQVHKRYLDEVIREFSIDPARLNMRRPNEFLASLAAELNIDVLDLLPAFQAATESPYYDYDEHLTAAGHRVMAQAIGERLKKRVGTHNIRVLSDGVGADRYPLVSQDGSMLTYQSVRDGNMELFVATADLRERRRLTFNDVDESHPMLSQDNTRIVFTEGAAESHRTKIVVMALDGTHRTVLMPEPNVFGAIPNFSRSNLQVGYAEWVYDEASRRFSLPRIVVLDLFSGKKRYVSPAGRDSWRPIFSPDGSSVYYISKVSDQFDLYAYDLNSDTERQLTRTAFDEWDPQVSTDGRQLVYAARVDGSWELHLLDLASSGLRRLTRTKGDEWDPSFTPDGRSILYAGRFGLTEAMYEMSFEP
jgi:lysophospholipase L1-like esterase